MDRARLVADGSALTDARTVEALTVQAPAAHAAAAGASLRTGRDGALSLRFERRDTRTVLAACRSRLPLQVLAPVELDDAAAIVSILNPTGGLVGGDRLAIDVVAEAGAHACLTTPSATKVYRTSGEPAVQDVRMDVAAGAVIEWVPDHTIPFAGSAFRQRIDVTMGAGARLILVDAFAAGRVARDEMWRFALLDSTLRIDDAHGCRLHDRFVLDGRGMAARLGFAESAPYFGTVAAIGTGANVLAAMTAAMTSVRDVRWGAAPLSNAGVVVRCLAANAPALLEAMETLWSAARRAMLGLSALALRKS